MHKSIGLALWLLIIGSCLFLAFMAGHVSGTGTFWSPYAVAGSLFVGFLCLFFYATAKNMSRSMESRIRSARGKPAELGDAFWPGQALKVLAVVEDGKHAVVKSLYGTRLVRFKKKPDIVAGRHYVLNEENDLLDLHEITSPKPERVIKGFTSPIA